MPTTGDYLRDAQHFEEWCRDEFLPGNPFESLSPTACVNTILRHLSRFLWIEREVVEFDKRKLIPRYLANDPPFIDDEVFHHVGAFLDLRGLSETEIEWLRQHTEMLRAQMNAHLGIKV